MNKMMVRDVPHDSQLPQLSTGLDAAAMVELFDALLFHGDSRLTEVEYFPQRGAISPALRPKRCLIERVKYKPANNCLICYRLEVEDSRSGLEHSQRFCGRLYPIGQSASRFRRAQGQPLVQPKVGPALMHLPQLGMVIWSFPNDRKLLQLPKFSDGAYLKQRLLPPVVAAHLGEGWQIANVRHELVHYAAEYTCTMRVQLGLIQQQMGKEESLTLFGKLYENEQGRETEQMMRLLWASEARVSGHLKMAQPLGYDPELRILWQQGLEGQTLQSYGSEMSGCAPEGFASPTFKELLGKAAATVAHLHQSPVRCSRRVDLAESIGKLETMRHLLSQVRPGCRGVVSMLVDRLLEQASSLEEWPVALLHGDLHLQNFFVEGEQVALIDMDQLQRGSPWRDIGSLLAALHYRALLAGAPLAAVEDAATLFCTHYAQQVTWPLSPAAIRWYTAAALINERALRAITRLQSGPLEIVDTLLDRALCLLEAV